MENNNAKTLLAAAASLGEIRYPIPGTRGEGAFIIVPEGYDVHDLEHLMPAPNRKRANVVTADAASFVCYIKKHGSLDDCTIYADVDSEKSVCILIAIINDHGEDKPQWRDHQCRFEPKQSVEWKRWISKNRAVMNQSDFATWLEDNLSDVALVAEMPTGADILTMALGFEANAEKRLRSKINLQNGGVQFEFIEDETKETRTSMKVFERFTLGLPVFDGSSNAYPLEARLKYRDREGKVSFWYELIRPDRVFKTAVTTELDAIRTATGMPILFGKHA